MNGHSIPLPGSNAIRGSAKRKLHSPSVSAASRSTSVRAVGLVVDGEDVARLQPARPALGAELSTQLGVGADRDRGRRRRDLAAERARHRHHLKRPRAGLRLRGARRVQVDLDLLLVGAAASVGNEIRGRRGDRPPAVGQAAHRQIEVVHHIRLVADQPQERGPSAGRHRHRDLALTRPILPRQAQRQRRRARWRLVTAPGAPAPAAGRTISGPIVMLGSRSCGVIGCAAAADAGAAADAEAASVLRAAVSALAAVSLAGAATAGIAFVGSQRRYSPQLQKSASSGFSLPQLRQIVTTSPRSEPRHRGDGHAVSVRGQRKAAVCGTCCLRSLKC